MLKFILQIVMEDMDIQYKRKELRDDFDNWYEECRIFSQDRTTYDSGRNKGFSLEVQKPEEGWSIITDVTTGILQQRRGHM